MGVMDFLSKAYEKYQEYAPQLMELKQDIDGHKMEYRRLGNKELVNELNKQRNHRARRMAIVMLLKERGLEQDSEGVWRKG